MSGRRRVWVRRAVRMAWFRRARSLLAAWLLACSFVLCMATPSRAEDVRPRERRVCVRPPGETLDRWVFFERRQGAHGALGFAGIRPPQDNRLRLRSERAPDKRDVLSRAAVWWPEMPPEGRAEQGRTESAPQEERSRAAQEQDEKSASLGLTPVINEHHRTHLSRSPSECGRRMSCEAWQRLITRASPGFRVKRGHRCAPARDDLHPFQRIE